MPGLEEMEDTTEDFEQDDQESAESLPDNNLVCIVMPARNEFAIGDLLNRIFEKIPDNNVNIILSVRGSNDEFIEQVSEMSEKDNRIHHVESGSTNQNLAFDYLKGYEKAMTLNPYFIIEMDSGGSFDPKYLPAFLELLSQDKDAVLATRFEGEGRIANHNMQRVIVSWMGTFLANNLLDLGRKVSDMTSGYEGFTPELIEEIFNRVPIEQWISVTNGPGHFFQTEMRTYAFWLSQLKDYEIAMLPIVMGEGKVRKPRKLPLTTLAKSFESLILLRKRRELFRE